MDLILNSYFNGGILSRPNISIVFSDSYLIYKLSIYVGTNVTI